MLHSYTQTSPHSSIRSSPNDIFLLENIKGLLNDLIGRFPISQRFHPRLYTYADYILPKLYAILTRQSTENACEALNQQCQIYYRQKFHLTPRLFNDRIRHRRLVPHQTDVDQFFRRLTEWEVNFIFGNLLAQLNHKIQTRYIGGSTMRLLADNIEYGYYGHPTPPFDIGTLRKTGTQVCRMFQGHVLQGCGMTLFTDLYLLRKSQYRSQHIPFTGRWLKFCGYHLSYALMDREFYRAALIKRLKDLRIPVIIPAKKYKRVQTSIQQYLRGEGPLMHQYLFAQTSNYKVWQKSVHVWLVIVGHNNQSALEIRRQYLQGRLDFDQAYHKLSAFFTTLSPPKNRIQWARFLTRVYKYRWNEETAFREIKTLHTQFRYRSPVVHLAELYLRTIIYNSWQAWRKTRMGLRTFCSHRTLDTYRPLLICQLENQIKMLVAQNVRYLQPIKRKKYFE